jgi:LPXTG-site transpeptidase (sortase) family protein
MPTAAYGRFFSYRRANNVLLVLIVLINGYIISAPFLPAARYWWQEHVQHTSQKLSTQLHTPVTQGTPGNNQVKAPQENRLVVPAMQLDAEVFEDADMSALNKGLWHRPATSTPDKGGNTVIAGHRFTYTNPTGIFYYLDKVKVGDPIGLWWQQKRYLYTVTSVRTVPPTEISVEDNTSDPRLTLYTCTPLWAPHDRLVVVAEQQESTP